MIQAKSASRPSRRIEPSRIASRLKAKKTIKSRSTSIAWAMKRLPRPARVYSKATRSGVATTRPSGLSAGCIKALSLAPPGGGSNANCKYPRVVRADEFVQRRQDSWSRLESLLKRASGSRLGGLRPDEVLTLAALYRRSTADLARAQRDWPDEPVTGYLNGLVARGHSALYREGRALLPRLARFYTHPVPRTYRASARFVLASALLLFGPAAVAFAALWAQPALADRFVPPALLDLIKHHHLWTQIPPDSRPLASGVIMANNIWVSILALSLGLAFALPTIVVLVMNGVNLGALLGLTTA